MATQYAAAKKDDLARQALRRAYWLAKIDPQADKQVAVTKKLAKELKVEDLLKETDSAELYRELGLVEITFAGATAPIEVGLDQPAFFFAVDPEGKLHVFNWRIQPMGTRYKVSEGHYSKGTSSWGSGNLLSEEEVSHESQFASGLGNVTVEIKHQPDQRFRFVGSLEPN